MSVLFHVRRGRAVLGATIVLALVTLGSTAIARIDLSARPSWLGFALACAGALLIGLAAGTATTALVRRPRPADLPA